MNKKPNHTKIITEIVFLLVVAIIITAILQVIIAFAAQNFTSGDKALEIANIVGATFFGLVIGYKLNTLLHRNKA